jgi:hypothetical protein
MFSIEVEDKIYNEMISKGVVSEVRSLSKLADKIKKDFDKIDAHGKYITQKMNFGGSQAFGAKSNSTYPTGQQVSPGEALLRVKRFEMFTMHFDGLSLELAEKGGSPIDPEDFEQQELFKGMGDDMSRQLMLDGSGVICQANGAGSGTTALVVNSPYFSKPASLFFNPGRVIDAYLAAAQEINSIAIAAIASDVQLTLASNQTWSDDSNIYGEDVYTGTEAVGKGEIMGLLGIVRDTDPPAPNAAAGLQGLPVASYPLWKAKVWDNKGVARPFDEDLMIKALQYAEKRGKITVLLITEGIFRLWKQHLEAYKVLGSEPKSMWGGWVALPFYYDGRIIPMVQDLYVPDGTIMGLAEDEFTLHLTNPAWVTWEKVGGSRLQKVANKNEYVSEGHIFGNLGVRSRAPHFRITDIEEPE